VQLRVDLLRNGIPGTIDDVVGDGVLERSVDVPDLADNVGREEVEVVSPDKISTLRFGAVVRPEIGLAEPYNAGSSWRRAQARGGAMATETDDRD